MSGWQRGDLRGRRPLPGDLDAYRALLGDPAVARWLWWRKFDEAAVREWHQDDLRHWERFGFGPWLLFEQASGEFVGRGGLRWGELKGEEAVELTWSVRSAHWGRGYASTVAALAVEEADSLGLEAVFALVELENVASWRVAEKVGMRVEEELEYDGAPHRLYRLPA